MTKHRKILNFLTILRGSHKDMEQIFTEGSCLNLFLLLKNQYSEAVPYYNSNHIITKIGKYYYDINGVVMNTKGYLRFDRYYNKTRVSKSFKQMEQ